MVSSNFFIVFYGVIGTLSHSKIILEFLLQNDKPQAFYEGGDPRSTPLLPKGGTPSTPPLTLIKNEGEGIKNLLSNTIIFFQGKKEIRQN